jgi:hypothetical protein
MNYCCCCCDDEVGVERIEERTEEDSPALGMEAEDILVAVDNPAVDILVVDIPAVDIPVVDIPVGDILPSRVPPAVDILPFRVPPADNLIIKNQIQN